MQKKCRLFIKLHHSCIVNSQKLINTSHFGYSLVLTFRFFLDDELIDRVILRLMYLEGMHNLVAGLTQVS